MCDQALLLSMQWPPLLSLFPIRATLLRSTWRQVLAAARVVLVELPGGWATGQGAFVGAPPLADWM